MLNTREYWYEERVVGVIEKSSSRQGYIAHRQKFVSDKTRNVEDARQYNRPLRATLPCIP